MTIVGFTTERDAVSLYDIGRERQRYEIAIGGSCSSIQGNPPEHMSTMERKKRIRKKKGSSKKIDNIVGARRVKKGSARGGKPLKKEVHGTAVGSSKKGDLTQGGGGGTTDEWEGATKRRALAKAIYSWGMRSPYGRRSTVWHRKGGRIDVGVRLIRVKMDDSGRRGFKARLFRSGSEKDCKLREGEGE